MTNYSLSFSFNYSLMPFSLKRASDNALPAVKTGSTCLWDHSCKFSQSKVGRIRVVSGNKADSKGLPEKRDSNSFSQTHFISFLSPLTRSLAHSWRWKWPPRGLQCRQGRENKGLALGQCLWLGQDLCQHLPSSAFPQRGDRELEQWKGRWNS